MTIDIYADKPIKSLDRRVSQIKRNLERAIRYDRGIIIIALYRSDWVRLAVQEDLIHFIHDAGYSPKEIIITSDQPDLPQRLYQEQNIDKTIVFGLGWRFGEEPAYRALNLKRDLFLANKWCVVLWFTETEINQLIRTATDFWVFRHLYVEFIDAPTTQEIEVRTGVDEMRQILREQEYLHSLTSFHDSEKIEDQIKWRQSLLDQLPSEDTDTHAYLLRSIGDHLSYLFRFDQAIVCYEKFLVINEKPHHKNVVLMALGNAYANLGQVEKAIELYEQALIISREIGDRRGEGNHLGNLGIAYSNLGRVRDAITQYKQALNISREIGDRHSEGNHLGNLGNAYSNLGRMEDAIVQYKQALSISREVGDRRSEGDHLGNLGVAYALIGQFWGAIVQYEQSLIIHREIGDQRGEGYILSNLGMTYADLGRVEEAKKFWEQAFVIFTEIKSPRAGEVQEWINEIHVEA